MKALPTLTQSAHLTLPTTPLFYAIEASLLYLLTHWGNLASATLFHSACGGQAEGEAVLAMELWWRAASLEALQAYMAGVLSQASRSHSLRLQRLLGSLLQPTLDAVFSSPALQASPALAACRHRPFTLPIILHLSTCCRPRSGRALG